MPRFIFLVVVAVVAGGWLAAAPVPEAPRLIVARLGDPTTKVRDEAVAALTNRPDAAPWLRRAAQSRDRDTVARAEKLLVGYDRKRQDGVKRAIDACIKSGQVDLFMEWHHYWQPESKDDLWPVGPKMARAGQDEYAKSCPPDAAKVFEECLDATGGNLRFYDGPWAQLPRKGLRSHYLSIRTDQWWKAPSSISHVVFASVARSALLDQRPSGRFFVLGSVVHMASGPVANIKFVVCDGEFRCGHFGTGFEAWRGAVVEFIACHGDYRGGSVVASVLLVDGAVELFDDGGCEVKDSLIRASGEIRIPKTVKVVNSKIEPHAKDATFPYKFFELADVGVSLVDDEEGLVVADVKSNTPFGNSGLKKGDIIQMIDDVRAGHSSEFRKQVRRALVRQGDCLLTVARGREKLDLPVYFPLPK